MTGAQAVRFELPDGYPAAAPFFQGHFPGRPIVPGAVLLAEAARRLSDLGAEIAAVHRVKFLRTVAPGEAFRVEVAGWTGTGPVDATIDWLSAAGLVARARVRLVSVLA